MALAFAYAISGLSEQAKLCSTIYGGREDLITFLPASFGVCTLFGSFPPLLGLVSTASLILIPPHEARILDTKRTEAQLARDLDRASRLLPPHWQNVTLRFVLNLSGQAPATTLSVFSTSGTERWAIVSAKEPQQGRNASPSLPVSYTHRTPLRPTIRVTTTTATASIPSSPKLAQSPIAYCSPPYFRLISTVATSQFASIWLVGKTATDSVQATGTLPRSSN